MPSSHRRLDPYSEEGPRNAHYDVRYPPSSTASKHGIAQAFLAGSSRSQIGQIPHGGPRKTDYYDLENISAEFSGVPTVWTMMDPDKLIKDRLSV
jgi:hypothetical protein